MKLLITDDEMQIRTGLELGIDWKKLGFDTVITAQDGLDAMEKCILYQPVKIIILSGFSDFEYARNKMVMS